MIIVLGSLLYQGWDMGAKGIVFSSCDRKSVSQKLWNGREQRASLPTHDPWPRSQAESSCQKDSWQHFLTLEPARESDDYHRCEKWWIAIAWVVLGHTIVNHRPIAWHCSQRHISNLSHAFMTRRFERKWPVEKLGKEMSYISEFSSQLKKNAIWRLLEQNTDITQSYCRLPHGTGVLPNIFALNRNPAPPI